MLEVDGQTLSPQLVKHSRQLSECSIDRNSYRSCQALTAVYHDTNATVVTAKCDSR